MLLAGRDKDDDDDNKNNNNNNIAYVKYTIFQMCAHVDTFGR